MTLTRAVQVEINVNKVPQYYTAADDDLYLSGDFNDWSLKHPKFKFKKLSPSHYQLTFDLQLGTYMYKITKGTIDWTFNLDSFEILPGDKFQARKLVISTEAKQTINVEVENWKDSFGKHTVTGNVHLLSAKFPYPQFDATKKIYIYLPPDYETSGKRYSVVYMHDGVFNFDSWFDQNYGEIEIDETMESFYAQRKEVSIVVAIASTNRSMEYTPYPNYIEGMFDEVGGSADLYLDFLVNRLKPYVDGHYRTKPDRNNTALIGSSLGGLVSFYGGLKYENTFSRMGIYSATFVWNYTIYEWARQNLPKYENTKLYFTAGSLEVADYFVHINMSADMLKMIDLLNSYGHGNKIRYSIREEGHTNSFWAREFPLTYSWWFHE